MAMEEFGVGIKLLIDWNDIAKQVKTGGPIEVDAVFSGDSVKKMKGEIGDIGKFANKTFSSLGNVRFPELYSNNLANSFDEIESQTKRTKEQFNNLSKALRSFGFGDAAIKSVTGDITEMGLAVDKVTTKLRSNGDVDITVHGIDEMGRAVKVMRELKSLGDGSFEIKVPKVDTIVTSSSDEVKKINSDFQELITTLKRMYSLQGELRKYDYLPDDVKAVTSVDKVVEQYANAVNRVGELKSRLGIDNDELEPRVSDEQLRRFRLTTEQCENSYDALEERLQNTSAQEILQQETKRTDAEIEELCGTIEKMNALEAKARGFELEGKAEQAKEYRDEIAGLIKELGKYDDLIVRKNAGLLSPEQSFKIDSAMDSFGNDKSIDNYVGRARAKLADAANAKQLKEEAAKTDAEIKELCDTIERMNALEAKAQGFELTDDIKQAEQYRKELESLIVEFEKYNDLIARKNSGKLSEEQNIKIDSAMGSLLDDESIDNYVGRIKARLEDAQNKINAKLAESQAKLASSLVSDFNNDKFSKELNEMSFAYDKIRNKTEALNSAYAEFTSAQNTLCSALAKGENNVDEIVAANDKYLVSLEKLENQLKMNETAQKKADEANKLSLDKQNFSNDIDIWLERNSAAAKQFGDRIRELQARIEACDRTELNNLKAEFKSIIKEAEKANVTGLKFGEALAKKFKEYSSYFVASFGIMEVVQGLKQMAQEVLEVDTAMTGLYRVTDLSTNQYAELYDNMVDSAKKYGATLTDIINATSDWVRAGFDADEAIGLAEVTTMYQHISDLDYDTAAENLLTSFNGFKEELLNAYGGDAVDAVGYVGDVLNELDNKFSVTAAGLGEGLARSASALALAGNTYTEAAAMIGAVTEVTQDPEKAGSAMKVLSLRLRGMKGQLEEMGEEVDDNVENISKMQGQILNMTGGKVNIFDDNGDFRSTYDIMVDIAKVYDELSSTDQANLLETIAGKHRANDVAALIQNIDNAIAMNEAAMDAEGSAAREHAKYVDSIQGRIDALTASWQDFANTVMSSDFIKNLVSGANDLLDLFTIIVDTFGTLPLLASALGAALSVKGVGFLTAIDTQLTGLTNKFALFGKSINDIQRDMGSGQGMFTALFSNVNYEKGITQKDIECISNFIDLTKKGVPTAHAWKETMTGATVAGKKMAKKVKTGAVSIDTLTKSAKTSKVAMTGLKVASVALNAAMSMGLAVVIDLIITGLDKLINRAKNASDAANDLKIESMNAADEANEEAKTIDELIEKYEELARSDNQDASTRAEIRDIQSQITTLVGEQAGNLDLVNGKLDDQLDKLLEIKRIKAEEVAQESEAAYYAAMESSKNAIPSTKAYKNYYDFYGEIDQETYDLIDDYLEENGYVQYYRSTNFGPREKHSPLGSRNLATGNATLTAVGDDAEEKIEFLEGVVKELEYAGLQSSQIYQDLVQQIADYRVYANDVDSTAESLLNSIINVVSLDNELYGMTVNSLETFGEYRQAMIDNVLNSPDIQNAIANGDITELDITEAVNSYLASIDGFSDYYNEFISDIGSLSDVENITGIKLTDFTGIDEESANEFRNAVDEHLESVNELETALEDFNSGKLDQTGIDSLLEKFPELQEIMDDMGISTANLDLAIAHLLDDMDEELSGEYDSIFGALDLSDEDRARLDSIMATILECGNIIDNTSFDIDIEVETSGLEKLKTALEESASATGLSAESIANLENRYNDLESYDAAKLFEKTANGIKVNRKALNALEKEYVQNKKAAANLDLTALRAKYNDLTNALDNCTDASQRASIYAQREAILSQIEDTAIAAANYDALTGAYQRWIDAQAGPEDYDAYGSVVTGYDDVQDEISRGFLGNASKEYIDLMSGADLVGASIDEYYAAFERLDDIVTSTGFSILDFFTLDEDGNVTAEGVHRFFTSLQSDFNGSVAKFNEETGEWTYDFSKENLELIQAQYGMGIEAIQIMLEAAAAAGYDVDWDGLLDNLDLDTSDFETLIELAESAETALNKITGKEYSFNFMATNVEDAQKQIDEFQKDYIDLITNDDGTINLNAEGAEEARVILAALIIQKQQLSQPAIMSVDTSQLSESQSDISEAITAAEQFQAAYENYEIALATGIDVEQAEQQLSEAITALEGTDAEVRASLKLPSDEELQAASAEIGTLPIGTDLKAEETAIGALETKIQTECTPEVIAKVTGIEWDELETDTSKTVEVSFTSEGDVEISAWYDGIADKTVTITFKKSELSDDVQSEIDNITGKNVEVGVTTGEVDDTTVDDYEPNPETVQTATGEIDDSTVDGYEPSPETLGVTTGDVDDSTVDGYEPSPETLDVATGDVADDSVDEYDAGTADLGVKTGEVDDSTIAEFHPETEAYVRYSPDGQLLIGYQPDKNAFVIYSPNESILATYTPDDPDAFVIYNPFTGILSLYDPDAKSAEVIYSPNADGLSDFNPDPVTGTVTFERVSTAVDEYNPFPDGILRDVTFSRISSEVDTYNPPNFDRTVTYTLAFANGTAPTIPKVTGNIPGQLVGTQSLWQEADGTAHVNGTAFAEGTVGRAFKHGDWGVKGSGTALVGELGQELVVRDGRFFTVGDNGAEFFQYKPNDIIFNAGQTKQLFEQGKIVNGKTRGRAVASGTAFAEGNAFVDGLAFSNSSTINSRIWEATATVTEFVKTSIQNTSGTSVKRTSAGTSPSSSSSSSTSSSSSSSDSTKEFLETIDWIEIAIDRIERAISRLDLKVSSVFKKWTTRNEALVDEIALVRDEIELQQAAYERYIKQANSVGLSEDYAAKVRNGEINIEDITDESLKEQVDEYQEWYEKALDCSDAVEELKEQVSELYQIAFDNIVTEYEGYLSIIEHERSMLEEYINQSEANAWLVSAEYYKALEENERDTLAKLKEEKASLLASLNDAVANGNIEEGSEAWVEMINSIDEVTLAIEESNTQLMEYQQTLQQLDWEVFDLTQEKISRIADEAEFLIDLLDSDELYTDNGQLTDSGMSTMGLHGVEYNVAMAQADMYADKIKEVREELAKDPYDTELEEHLNELIETQRDYISSAQDAKEAIRDMVEEGIQLELEALQELIDKRNEALDSQKD